MCNILDIPTACGKINWLDFTDLLKMKVTSIFTGHVSEVDRDPKKPSMKKKGIIPFVWVPKL